MTPRAEPSEGSVRQCVGATTVPQLDLSLARVGDGRRLAPGDAPGTLDLNKLFIEPLHIRGRIGHALLAHPVARRAAGVEVFGKCRRASGSPPDR